MKDWTEAVTESVNELIPETRWLGSLVVRASDF